MHVYIVIIKYGCYALTNVSMYDHDASLNTSPFIIYMHTVLMNHVPSLRALPESEHMTSYVESFCPSNLSHASVHECAIICYLLQAKYNLFQALWTVFILFFTIFIHSNNHVTIQNKVIMWLCIISYYIIIIKGAGDTKVHRHRL